MIVFFSSLSSTARFAFLSVLSTAGLFATVLSGTAQAADRALETRGTLVTSDDGQIAPDVWAGLSRSDALLLIRSLPEKYASPTYYEIARRFLLSDAPSFPADAPVKHDPKDPKPKHNPDSPDILIARLDKLLEMGALRDAETLYDTVVPDVPASFDLVFRSLKILMLRGQLSAACLDLQAMQGQHGNNPAWKEMNRLCRIQFSGGAERGRLIAESKFTQFPRLGQMLRANTVGNLNGLSTDDLAFAAGLGLVNENSLRTLTPRAGSLSPLLLSVLYQMDTREAMPEKTCIAIEAARRGVASPRELIAYYERPHYDAALLLDNIRTVTAPPGLHPCMVPTVMYQRIASNKQPANRDTTIRAALDVMADLPDAAFWPMAVYFHDFNVHANTNKKYLWRATRIVAYEKDELPESWASGWGAEGGQAGVPPFWPVQAIVSPQVVSMDGLSLWRQQWPSEARRVASRDPVIPLLLGQSLSSLAAQTGQNPKGKLSDYENIFPLTFSRSYAMPSYGLTQKFSDVIKNNRTGQSVALLLIGYGAIPPDQVIPHQMALVIEGLNKAGLGRYARRFALEVLR